MLPLRHNTGMERRLNRYAGTILVGGVFLTLCGVLFLTLCGMSCDDQTYGLHHNDDYSDSILKARSKAFWEQHPLAPPRDLKTFLLVLVMSGPGNQHQRNTIRQTWVSDAPGGSDVVMVRFIIGTQGLMREVEESVSREQYVHNDLVLMGTLEESYKNLTAKLLTGLQWADVTVDYKFLLKVDDDSYVRLGPIVKELQQPPGGHNNKPSQGLYWGFFNGRAHVKKSGKWAEKEWFLCDRYLPYALGGGYILSNDLVHYVSTNSKLLQLYNSEDVSLGTWLAPLKISRVHDERFDTEFVSRGCRNDYLITHKQSPMSMQGLHENLHKFRELCLHEVVKRDSYKYDWEALPSKCCVRNDKILD